jgi:hypothetical protein
MLDDLKGNVDRGSQNLRPTFAHSITTHSTKGVFVAELDRTRIVSRVASFTRRTSSLSFGFVDHQRKYDQKSQRRSKDQGKEVGVDIREREGSVAKP